MEQLRRLDRSATRKGTVVSVVVGVISCLLLGIGMCCTMVWMQWFVPGVCDRGDRNCGHRSSVPAVHPHHQARAGTAGAADFKADRGAFPGGIKKEEQQKFFCCSSFWYQARGRESTGFPPRLAVSASGPALFCAGEAERPRQRRTAARTITTAAM